MTDRSHWFVQPSWLIAHLNDPDVVVVDGSWHLAGRNARAEYEATHIPGAVFFDIDAIADTASPLPHMLPSPLAFAAAVGALGIDSRQKIVVYDSAGLSSAPRVWWTFRVMGAADVVILDGGLPAWIAEGLPTDANRVSRAPGNFETDFDPRAIVDLGGVRDGLAGGLFQVIDARPAPRFFGEAPEPRGWVKSGRIPGSLNVPSSDLISEGRLKGDDALRRAFLSVGADISRPIVTSCGSGVNAAILSLALDILGVRDSALYDGSWTEWGARDDTRIATGR